MIYFLLFLLLIILIIIFILNSNDIITPAFLFTASISMGVLWAALYTKKWELLLHNNTFFVILGGTFLFGLMCFFVHELFIISYKRTYDRIDWQNQTINIQQYKLVFFILFEVFTIFYSIYAVVQATGGSMNNFTTSVVQYRNMNMFFGESIVLSRTVTYSRILVDAAGYWFGYTLVNNYFVEKKINKLMLVIVMLSAISSYILGGRNGLVNIFFSVICSFFIVSNKLHNFKSNVKTSTLIKLIVVFVVILSSFESLAFLIGRSGFDNATGLDYLAVYIGAPVKNLDTFLQEYSTSYHYQNNQTFIYLINWLGNKVGLVSSSLDLPFRQINGETLGNVYTTFYAYVHDYGYMGIIVLVPIMATISQTIYEKVRLSKITVYPAISSLIYVYVSNLLVMSFFSNKFYEQFFNISLVRTIIAWLFFRFVFISPNKNLDSLNQK